MLRRLLSTMPLPRKIRIDASSNKLFTEDYNPEILYQCVYNKEKDKKLELEENAKIKYALYDKYGEQLRNIVG